MLEDERELQALLARYSLNADLGRSREYTQTYTKAGAIDFGAQRPSANIPVPARLQGHDNILFKFMTRRADRSIEGHSQHHTNGPTVFHIDGDDATGEAYSFLLVRRPEAIEVFTANFNQSTLRRVGGVWKIAERFVRTIGPDETQDAIIRTTD